MAVRSLLRLAAALATATLSSSTYQVSVAFAPQDPVISYLDGNTAWPQSFNPAYVEASAGTGGKYGLLIRSQNCTNFVPGKCIGCNVGETPFWQDSDGFVGSVISFAQLNDDGTFDAPYLVFAPDANAPVNEDYGTEDPRLAYDASTGLYHMFYTCYGKPGPFLCHATTTDPTAPYPGNWTRHGTPFVNEPEDSKSGALLIMPQPPHYLIWGAGVIGLATTNDLYNYTMVNKSFITARKDYFDNQLVEAGPPPLRLLDGNYIFFHNSDNTSSISDFGSYNPGWVILDGTDPTNILQRSDVPLLSPTHGWEQGVAPYECNVHNVTFLEAARRVPGAPGDQFDVWFGGSDAVIGTARIVVTTSD